ncbi:hypothetical protein CW745_12700 [Psychromonas sp. psych-6C06]|uniref:Lnb N-terminal periplasmic domain-containing protein n=1 Tax=Psychromonas sp. psych-6C06 TaxID=2058089 RepID=UPI000C3390E4|nr:DUF4105 domain-containing protein [Psychromonas sp. psych-6C06]PKF60729.1 hypothetical protein CW745_12700 [Psychromonas sp. psych-6C06]
MTKNSKILACLLTLLSTPVLASSNTITSLAQHSYWLQLGHYRSAVLSDWKSEVDDNAFFIAKNGKKDPLAELNATVDAFNGKGLTAKETQQIICRFPARFNWLKTKIENNWGELDCPEMQQWQTTIDPAGMTLVFPTAFMNNPSSMFGHTLLRIDAKDQTRNKELVAFAVNFAAQPDMQDNAATYAFKGLVGSYPGLFTLMPYYRKVREYNDLESRDIWEYRLNLTPEEVDKVLLHLWELQSADFDYYFIDENCSYQLLALLQLAKEDLDLTSQFSMQAIPSDTVAALRDSQLLQEPNYRAAFGTKLYHYSEQLTDHDLIVAREVMQGAELDSTDYTPEQQAAILEMAYEWLNFEFYDQALNREEIAPQLTKLLIKRSKIKLPSPLSQPLQPEVSPEKGHASSRFGIAYTGSNHYQDRVSVAYRMAYHDLLDQSAGFIPGAQISFLDIEASVDKHANSRVEKLYLIDAMSLAVDNRIFDSWAWNLRIGYDRQADTTKQSGHWFTQGGYGKSLGDPNHLQTYLLGSFALNAGDITNDTLEVGLGAEFGAIWQVNSVNKIALTGNVMYLIDSDIDYHSQIDLGWNWSFERNWALRSHLKYQQWRENDSQFKINLYHYF